MRRLWAHIALAFTALLTVSATFVNVFTKTSSNNEYQEGRQITFRVSEKKDDDNAEAVSEEGTEEIAKEMVRRLKVAKVTSYDVKIESPDTIKVFVSQDSNEDYSYLAHYLSFNGNLALSYGNDYIVSDEFLMEGKEAYIDTYNSHPCILLPVNVESEPYKTLIGQARKDKADETYNYAEETTHTNDDGSAGESTYSFYLYLWYDFVEGKCTFEATKNAADPYNERVLMKFQVTSNESGEDDGSGVPQYFPDDKKDKLYSAINIDTNNDGVATPEEKQIAYKRGTYFVNLINAGSLKYDVVNLFSETVSSPAKIESLITTSASNNHLVVAWSSTFAATLCAIVILTFLLVVYYRISAVSISSISIVATYIGLLAVLLFKAEFNTFGIIGLGIVALASIVSGTLYAHKIKEECYRGRSLKKANSEASKKSLLPIIDVNVVAIVIGVFCYIFGGALLRNFAVITVFGGIASLILNIFGLRGMMWLVTNSTKLQGKYEVFGVSKEQVPNIMNEEKQTYFGPYADSDLTKKKKPVGVALAALTIASIVGLSVFGGLALNNKNTMFATSKIGEVSEMYFETTNANSTFRKDAEIIKLLENIRLYKGDEATDETAKTSLLDYVDYTTINETEKSYDLKSYTREAIEEDLTVKYFYTVVTFNKTFSKEDKVALYNTTTNTYDVASSDDLTIEDAINELVETVIDDTKTKISCKAQTTYVESAPEFGPVGLGVLIATAVLGVYFMLRYRLSRGIASMIITLAVSVFSIGIFTLMRFIAIPTYIVAAIPYVAAFTMMFAVLLMNREREMVLEDRQHDNSVENRNVIMVKATSSAFAVMLPVLILSLYYAINFFGFGPQGTAWIYIAIILGIASGALAVTTLLGPISQFFFKLFSNIKVAKPTKKRINKTTKVKKSAEPEEATFIGIND